MKTLENLQTIKEAIRSKYAWPGGYPLFLICADGEALSIDAARDNWREICAAHMRNGFFDKQWQIAGVSINYEDSQLYCAHTGNRIESAYGEDETTESI
jgi:hypothetical protein